MAVERRDPLPPGRYSAFILPKETAEWTAWVAQHRDTVRVEATIDQRTIGGSEETAMFHADLDLKLITESGGSAVLFTVSAPTPWGGFGFPTIETRASTEWQKENSETSGPAVNTPLEQIRNLVLFAGVVYLAAAWLKKGK